MESYLWCSNTLATDRVVELYGPPGTEDAKNQPTSKSCDIQ